MRVIGPPLDWRANLKWRAFAGPFAPPVSRLHETDLLDLLRWPLSIILASGGSSRNGASKRWQPEQLARREFAALIQRGVD